MKCSNCLQSFQGPFAYTRHLGACNGDDKQCPVCRVWFMSKGQKDEHLTKRHEEGKA